MRNFFLSAISGFFILVLPSCNSIKSSSESSSGLQSPIFELIDQHIIPFDYQFQNTTVGGLSSIDYAGKNTWYIISDDRSEYEAARFYKVELLYDLDGFDSIIFKETIAINDVDGLAYELDAMDPEAIRFNPKLHTLFYSSEGGRTEGDLSPFIREMDTLGNFIKEFNIPLQFDFYADKGLRENGAFESLAFENDTVLWYANELPLIEDGGVPEYKNTSSPIRLSQIDVKNDKTMNQFAYMIEPVVALPDPATEFNINSVVELLVLDEHTLLVMERSFVTGVGNYVKVFQINTRNATNIADIPSLLSAKFTPVEKELVLDFSDFDLEIDNVEGMTFGPVLKDGRKSLVFISDNNFNESQQTQIWIFAVKGL